MNRERKSSTGKSEYIKTAWMNNKDDYDRFGSEVLRLFDIWDKDEMDNGAWVENDKPTDFDGLKITAIKFYATSGNSKVLAHGSLCLNGFINFSGFAIFEGEEKDLILFPSIKKESGR
jgi:hypothetical protein